MILLVLFSPLHFTLFYFSREKDDYRRPTYFHAILLLQSLDFQSWRKKILLASQEALCSPSLACPTTKITKQDALLIRCTASSWSCLAGSGLPFPLILRLWLTFLAARQPTSQLLHELKCCWMEPPWVLDRSHNAIAGTKYSSLVPPFTSLASLSVLTTEHGTLRAFHISEQVSSVFTLSVVTCCVILLTSLRDAKHYIERNHYFWNQIIFFFDWKMWILHKFCI